MSRYDRHLNYARTQREAGIPEEEPMSRSTLSAQWFVTGVGVGVLLTGLLLDLWGSLP